MNVLLAKLTVYGYIRQQLQHFIVARSNFFIPLDVIELCYKYYALILLIPDLYYIENDGMQSIPWAQKLTQPTPDTIHVRSKSYKQDGTKTVSLPIVFQVVHAQLFKTSYSETIDHIAIHPSSWFYRKGLHLIHNNRSSMFFIIINLQINILQISLVTYHVLDNIKTFNENGTPVIDDNEFNKVFDLVLNCTDNRIRDNRFKLIPRVVSGPYPVKRVVENRPTLLGNTIGQKYYRGDNYFEIDIRTDASMVASSIIRLCDKFSKRIIVDLAWMIQGENKEELPERVLCAYTIHKMDRTYAEKI